jgi:hypothetical protein
VRRASGLLIAAGIGLFALLLRLPALDSFLTPDERLWSQRTVLFLQALEGKDWANTLTTGHPGVTVMWAGSLGVALKTLLDQPAGEAGLAELIAELAAQPSQLDMIAWLRLPIAFATAVSVAIIFLLLRRLVTAPTAILATALLAFDPFLLAHSRVLHMDAMLTMTATVAWLALLVATRTDQRRFYALSGVAAGLAVLTKASALILGPLMVGWLVWHRWRRPPRVGNFQRSRQLLGDLLWVGLPTLATLVLVWPALWVTPTATLLRVWQFSTALGQSGHELGNFWLAKPVAVPGMLFYPAVLLWRTSPVSLIGLGLALVASVVILRHRSPDRLAPLKTDRSSETSTVWALWLFVCWFGLALSLGDKKFDRYLLPIFPALDILAAWGWIYALRWLARRKRLKKSALQSPEDAGRSQTGTITGAGDFPSLSTAHPDQDLDTGTTPPRSMAFLLAATALVIGQAAFAFSNLPTYLTAYNPLLGGIRTARQVMLVGWGEGLEEAASFLNGQPSAQTTRVASWYGHNVFGPFYQGPSADLYYDLPTAADLYADDVSFVVTYINQLQRGLLDQSILSRLGQPIMSSSSRDVPLAQVFAWPKPFGHTSDRELAPGLRLLGWTVGKLDTTTRELSIALYWDTMAAREIPSQLPPIAVWLKDEAGEVWAQSQQPVVTGSEHQVTGWLDRPVSKQEVVLALPAGLLAGSYPVEMAPEGGQGMILGEIAVPPTRFSGMTDLDATGLAVQVMFGDAVQLLGYDLVHDGQDWTLDLLWAARSQPPVTAKFFVHVVDPEGTIIAQQDGVLAAPAGQEIASWQQGEIIRLRAQLPAQAVDASSPLSIYVGLYHPEDGQRLPLVVDGEPVPDGRYLVPR